MLQQIHQIVNLVGMALFLYPVPQFVQFVLQEHILEMIMNVAQIAVRECILQKILQNVFIVGGGPILKKNPHLVQFVLPGHIHMVVYIVQNVLPDIFLQVIHQVVQNVPKELIQMRGLLPVFHAPQENIHIQEVQLVILAQLGNILK